MHCALFSTLHDLRVLLKCSTGKSATQSTLAQGKRAGPITLRSVDRNYEVLLFPLSFYRRENNGCLKSYELGAVDRKQSFDRV